MSESAMPRAMRRTTGTARVALLGLLLTPSPARAQSTAELLALKARTEAELASFDRRSATEAKAAYHVLGPEPARLLEEAELVLSQAGKSMGWRFAPGSRERQAPEVWCRRGGRSRGFPRPAADGDGAASARRATRRRDGEEGPGGTRRDPARPADSGRGDCKVGGRGEGREGIGAEVHARRVGRPSRGPRRNL